ncbi:MAG: DNA cytosine methyltransferase [Sinomicrobium sp.]|nr:DNA cytosine methyltransferase [Sinomicrobium sp.]
MAGGAHEFLYHNHGGDPNSKVWSIEKPNRTVLGGGTHYKVKLVFLKKYFSGRPDGKVSSVECPAETITTAGGHAVVTANFLQSYYGNGGAHSTDEPCPTLTTKDRFSKVEAQFLTNYYSNGGEHSSIEKPSPTVTGVPKQRLISCSFIDQQYGQSKPKSIEEPAGTITANPKLNIITAKPWVMDTNFNDVGSSIDEPSHTIIAARKHHYLVNPQFNSKGASVKSPAPTLIARQDKKPLSVVTCQESFGFGVIVYEDDSETMIKIKEFMAAYSIVDIKMRMLHISEMLRIQGFPEGYKLKGSKTKQKKQIGNAVEVHQATAIVEANYKALYKHSKLII